MRIYTPPKQELITSDRCDKHRKRMFDEMVGAITDEGELHDKDRFIIEILLARTLDNLFDSSEKTGVINKKPTYDAFSTIVTGISLTRAIGNFEFDPENMLVMPELASLPRLRQYDKIRIDRKLYDTYLVVDTLVAAGDSPDTKKLYDVFSKDYVSRGEGERLYALFKLARAVVTHTDEIKKNVLPRVQATWDKHKKECEHDHSPADGSHMSVKAL